MKCCTGGCACCENGKTPTRIVWFLPMVVILFIIGLIYVEYVFQFVVEALLKEPGSPSFAYGIFCFISFHVPFSLMMTSYYKAFSTKPESILLEEQGLTEEGRNSKARYCKTCLKHKAPRTHHCGCCKQCIPRMDHHCVWVGNCVGAHNQKFFVQFLLYIVLSTAYALLTVLITIAVFDQSINSRAWTLVILLSTLCFVFMLFAGFHMYLVCSNQTTIEFLQSCVHVRGSPERESYSVGCVNNFKQIFGNTKLGWVLPL